MTSHFPHWVNRTRWLASSERLPCTSRAHRRRVKASLLPGRVAPSVQPAAGHVCWSLSSSLLAAVVVRRVVWITPRRAGGGQELVECRCGCRLRVSNVISLITVSSSHCCWCWSSRGWLLLNVSWLPPSCRRLGTARGVHTIRLARIGSSVRKLVIIVKLVVGKAMLV